MPGHW